VRRAGWANRLALFIIAVPARRHQSSDPSLAEARHSPCCEGAVPGAPTRCLLCHDERVAVQKTSSTFIISCNACGATLAFVPHPPDDPSLAGRIELLDGPYQFFRLQPVGEIGDRH